jgi:predicted transposase/invertase (TIGR01784 family)
MSDEERRAYDRHIDNIMIQNDILETKMIEGMEQGRIEGRAKGLEEGRAEGRAEVARKLLALGTDMAIVSQATGMTEEEIRNL